MEKTLQAGAGFMRDVRSLVLCGHGINCEDETQYALRLAGAKADKVLVDQLIAEPGRLDDCEILAFPGGFSWADDLGAGKALAIEFKHKIGDSLERYIDSGRLMIGICNGFQMMIKLGFLPGFDGDYSTQRATLTYNDSGRFEDRWVRLETDPESPCVFTRGIAEIDLPVRHGEGKFYTGNDIDLLSRLSDNGQIVARYKDPERPWAKTAGYPWNPNGSEWDIAGICDPTGRVFGLMPHPEAYLHRVNHPRWTREELPEEGLGLQAFRNAVAYARKEL